MMENSSKGPTERRFAVALSEAVEGALSFQDYGEAAQIHDVRATRLQKHRSENGWFAELLKLDAAGTLEGDAAPGMPVRQISASFAEPGRINAFHIHPREEQNEVWTVLRGSLAVWLIDCRKGSPSEGIRQRIVLSGEEPTQLYIPAGVAHGYRAGGEGALLVYIMNQQFRRDAPNEGRLPWDHFGADLWAEDRG